MQINARYAKADSGDAADTFATGGKLVDIGGVHVAATVSTGGPGAVIVSHEHDDVRAARPAARGDGERGASGGRYPISAG